ncbi:MAG: hypothetical protein NTV52_21365, partial [Acidobacteria bacterium]|nr:hypothetical protein [Acidobacteriota bacterium]
MPALCLAASAPTPGLLFEANQGQAPSSVLFLARAPHYQIFLESLGTRIALPGLGSLWVTMPGSSPQNPFTPGPTTPITTDYILGNDPAHWHRNIPTYQSIRRNNVYPGIDIVHYSNPDRLEYDLIVHPRAEPGSFRLQFRGQSGGIRINPSGQLVIPVGSGNLLQRVPVAYQLSDQGIRESVTARWVLAGAQTARIELGPYDRQRQLIIDPEIEAAAALGGPGSDEWTGVQRIGSYLIAAGVTEAFDLPGAFGRRGKDITLVVLDPQTLRPLRAAYIGGSGTDRPLGLTRGLSGGVRVVGETNSRDFPIRFGDLRSPPPLQPAYGGGLTDGFAFEYDFFAFTQDPYIAGTYIGGSQEDRATGVFDQVVFGETRSNDLPGTQTGQFRGGWDGFSLSLDFRNNVALLNYFGGSGDERVRGVLPLGNHWLAYGSTNSPDLALQNPWQSQLNGPRDGFLASIFVFPSLLPTAPPLTTYWGGSGDDEITAAAFASNGRLLLAGTTSSPDFPTVNATQPSFGGGPSDAFLAHIDLATSAILSATYFGGAGADAASHISPQLNAFSVAGTTSSENLSVRGSGQSTYGGGASDAF